MTSILLGNVGVVSAKAGERTSIAITDGLISAAGSSDKFDDVIDCSGLTAWPGFIDVHIHGAVGFDVNEADTDGLVEIARFLAANGVTAWMPTLVPDSDENYARIITSIDRLIEIQSDQPIAQAVGVHYEGVFANEKMCGALRPQYFKTFKGTELSGLPALKTGTHMTTFAPEVEGGVELAAELTRRRWVGSIGHTRADVDTLDRAFDAGARHVTHFFNAMTGLHHRDVGVAGWALTKGDLTIDIIADGVHVHPSMLALACRTKSADAVSLISDSVAPAGSGDGEFTVWGEKITVNNRRTQNERGSIAGSVISMHDAVMRMRSLGFSDHEVSLMASRNPARLVGVGDSRGTVEPGYRADIALLDGSGVIRLTLIGGKIAYSSL
jgi:N-acetylglucosamine-6-phosphate deacetylase